MGIPRAVVVEVGGVVVGGLRHGGGGLFTEVGAGVVRGGFERERVSGWQDGVDFLW